MCRARFDDLENSTLFDAQQNGGLGDRQHRFSAFRTSCLFTRRRLTNDESPLGDSQFFKIPFDFHTCVLSKTDPFVGDEDEFMIYGKKCLDFFWIYFGFFADCD